MIYWVWGLDHLRPWWDLQHCQWMPLLSCPWRKKLLWEGVKLKNRCYICVWGSFDILFKGKITYYHPQQLCYLLQIPIHARATLSLTSTTIILWHHSVWWVSFHTTTPQTPTPTSWSPPLWPLTYPSVCMVSRQPCRFSSCFLGCGSACGCLARGGWSTWPKLW